MSEQQTKEKKPMRWERNGVMHEAMGDWVHQGIYLVWTKCEKHDVPANGAWYGADEVTCEDCKK
jgi:hypothetical protein